MSPAEGGRRRRFIVAAALLPVAAVVVLEVALRVFGGGTADAPPIRFLGPERRDAERFQGYFVADPVLFWRLRPGWTVGRRPTPASGFVTDFETKKADGVRRVLCLGSSNTFGMGLASADRAWPALVGALLAAERHDERWEALNLGVPGYSSWQMRRLLETEAAALAPDVVVAETGAFNEWVPALGRIDREQGRAPQWTRPRVVDLVARVFAAGPSGAAAPARFEDLRTADYSGARRVPLADYEDDLRAIAGWCAERRVHAVFVAEPLPAKTIETNPIALEYAATLRRVAASAGVPVADGWAAFRASGRSDAELFRDFCHPTEAGHRLIVEAVLAAVRNVLASR